MAFTASLHEGELTVTAADPLTTADWLSLFDDIQAADPARRATHGLMDFSAVATLVEPDLETLHRVAVNSHLKYPRGPAFRVAFLIPDGSILDSLLDFYGHVVALVASTASTAPGSHPTGQAFADRDAALTWARPEPPRIERFDDRGYIATFSGLLTLHSIEHVRRRAGEMFETDELRWAVMDLSAAELQPALSPEQADARLESARSVGNRLHETRTSSLRVGLVADLERFGAAIELTLAEAEQLGPEPHERTWSMQRFDTVDEALDWARTPADPS